MGDIVTGSACIISIIIIGLVGLGVLWNTLVNATNRIDCPECDGGERQPPGPCPTCDGKMQVQRGARNQVPSHASFNGGGRRPKSCAPRKRRKVKRSDGQVFWW